MVKNSKSQAKPGPVLWQKVITTFPKTYLWSRRIAITLLVLFLVDTGYLMGIWPNWDLIKYGKIPESRFIEAYELKQAQNPTIPRMHWKTIDFDHIPHSMIKAVLAAEDYKFFQHGGVDTDALKKAIEYDWNQKRIVYGASTITQQTVKNLFLSGSRNPLRKWHEYLLTFAMEHNLSKKRILEIYLNVAEFGTGIFGIESAARKYWGISAADLTRTQCIELAATLPAPDKHNPRTRSAFFLKQRDKITANM